MNRLNAIMIAGFAALLILAACAPTQPSASKEYEFTSTDVQVPSRGTTIPATLVVPTGSSGEKFPLVVMHHGHGGGRNENGGFAKIAEALAKKGIITIRMDFPGAGDSKEPFTSLNYTNMINDSNASLVYAAKNAPVDTEKVGAFGYSEGSSISAILAGNPFTPYKAVALLGPVANPTSLFESFFGGKEQFDALYNEAKSKGSAEVITPFEQHQQTGLQWFEETLAARPAEEIKNFKGDVLILHGASEQIVPKSEAQAYLDAVKGSAKSSQLVSIADADHGYGFYSDQPAVTVELLKKITEFFSAKLK